jgi:beta-lactamase regulating signal transducer with metallopeptidase domain
MIPSLQTASHLVWQASWQAGVVVLLTAVALLCLRGRVAPRWRHVIWSVALARFLIVAVPETPWSVFNLLSNRVPAGHAEPMRIADAVPMALPLSEAPPAAPPVFDSRAETLPAPMLSPIETTAASIPTPVVVPAVWPSWSTPLVLAVMWLAGVVVVCMRLVLSQQMVRRLSRQSLPCVDLRLVRLLEESVAKLGLRLRPVLYVTAGRCGPCVIGAWRPRIVVPESLLCDLSDEQWRQVFLHELAHIRRGDLIANWLLLAVRTVHWFNPLAWWAVREAEAEREAACDDVALGGTYDAARREYADSIIKICESAVRLPLVPGLIGFRLRQSLHRRLRRVVDGSSAERVSPWAGAFLLATLIGVGFTGAKGRAYDEPRIRTEGTRDDKSKPSPAFAIRGTVADAVDKSPISGVSLRLYAIRGVPESVEEIGQQTSDAQGRYEFRELASPNPSRGGVHLAYVVVASSANRPVMAGDEFWTRMLASNDDGGSQSDPTVIDFDMPRQSESLKVRVVDAEGRPVAGARVFQSSVSFPHIPGLHDAVTDGDGRATIAGLSEQHEARGPNQFQVRHPDYAPSFAGVDAIPGQIEIVLNKGCHISGSVVDAVESKPAAGAVVIAQDVDELEQFQFDCDSEGRFQFTLAEGNYNFLVAFSGRVTPAVVNRECIAGASIKLPAFRMTNGGTIAGKLIDGRTGEPVSRTKEGKAIKVSFFGPSWPRRGFISDEAFGVVDAKGEFKLQVAPGEHFPWAVNVKSDREVWDIDSASPVVVREGETTELIIKTKVISTPEEKLAAARELAGKLPKDGKERAAAILAEFRMFDGKTWETETWCLLMKDLVGIGPPAVPVLCDELDRTVRQGTLRRLAFALRAIGDPRAVPALIRAIPRTLLPSSSDYGLNVEDPELMAFMQQHDLGDDKIHFGYGRPMREVFGALKKLTGHDIPMDFNYVSLSEDPNRSRLQREIFMQYAMQWQAWWEEHARDLVQDEAYRHVNLAAQAESPPLPKRALGPTSRVSGGWSGSVLSPPSVEGPYVDHLLDLDTGRQPFWPTDIPRTKEGIDSAKFREWAIVQGVDLVCVDTGARDGSPRYVLKAIGLELVEIGPQDARNLERRIRTGSLPEGRPAGELLVSADGDGKDVRPAFLYTTREGNRGMIRVTDQVTEARDITGSPVTVKGVGFHVGVRFDQREIVP